MPATTRRQAKAAAAKAASSKSTNGAKKGGDGKKEAASGTTLVQTVKLLIGTGGIYAAFMYYGLLQEDVFRFVSPTDGAMFTDVWFLQALEALFNVLVGGLGLLATGRTKGLPQKLFACTGATQVLAKYCTNAALASGLSFPVATLAKSGKMVPVMVGSLLLGGASYELKQYVQVAAIVGGTAIVSMANPKKGGEASAALGLAYVTGSLCLDGLTGGVQRRVKTEATKRGLKPKPYDYMFFTNLYMLLTALVFAAALGELRDGVSYCLAHPEILAKIIRFGACSAFGQSFIFFTIANFDPLVCTTVTTTRKIFSVLLSIFTKGHHINLQGWSGIALASAGILSEAFGKKSKKH